ncbi:MAG: cytochrome P450 [Acidimicrobiales bacterium]|nr:cytochrome P450 [Acidimicrobiales bacterium]MCB9392914.1 cytochrome P450 [Acidimicrobiaceae bacterium]
MAAGDEVTLADLDGRHHEVLADLRARGPVAWVEAVGGWVVTGRELAIEVMRDPARFTVDDPRFSTAQVVGPSMLSLDGAEHDRHRAPFAAAFRPADVTRRYAEEVTEMARRLVAELAPRGEAELRRQLAGPLAVAVVARSLGLERLDPAQLLAWYDAIVAGVAEIALGRPAADEAWRAFELLGEALGAAAHRPDSVLLEAASALSHMEVVSNAAVFLFGGIETSEGMTANLLHHVLTRPEVTARLRADRALIDAAVEESLRLEPAAARVDRFATRKVELAGTAIRCGDLVVVSLAAANRDPAAYDAPDEFRLDRPNARTHVAFAQGPHACLGAQLARMETRAALDAVLDLLPDVELVEPPVPAGVIFRKPFAVRARWSVLDH